MYRTAYMRLYPWQANFKTAVPYLERIIHINEIPLKKDNSTVLTIGGL